MSTRSHTLALTPTQTDELKAALGVEYVKLTLTVSDGADGAEHLSQVQLEDIVGGCQFCGDKTHNPW